ncbi:SIR2 family protein [Azospirillum brasilense]|uniref:Deacetylase sirtuin-type domain-containing protein n=1 Tax=Azospirillum brasilense TaxID=192 RepID=A0A6L3ASG4_AZOBR|nr:SIR2 family protein [Azospirillum brasilense]KAA0678339.1 hypothetical protein DS837_27980 [Azospirillum brasilense]
MPLQKMSVESFLRHICKTEQSGRDHPPKLTFFLGAGCSISSGIQGAAGLARMWWDGMDDDQRQLVPDYSDECAGAFYNKIVEAKFGLNEMLKQQELARIMRDARPSFGYIALAILIHKSTQWSCRDEQLSPVVLTTNFDDLLERAFLIHTPVVPVVVSHDALIDYSTSSRCIIKLHGDYRFLPYTDGPSTKSLSPDVQSRISKIIHNSDLIIIGYSGHDSGAASLIARCIQERDFSRIFWINPNPPGPEMEAAFKGATVYHVDSVTFDDLMAKILRFTEVQHPSPCRLMDHIDSYHDYFFERLQDKKRKNEDVVHLSNRFQDWFHVLHKALGFARAGDLDNAKLIIEKRMHIFAVISPFRMYCAHIFFDHNIDLNKANFHYRWALRLDQENARANAMYASFLIQHPQYIKSIGPEEYLNRAITLNPMDYNSIVNISGYLFSTDRIKDATYWLKRARGYPLSDVNCLEADFYELAHLYDKRRASELLRRIGKNLRNGVRPHNYRYENNVKAALSASSFGNGGHPLHNLIPQLAAVMEDRMPVSVLAWNQTFREACGGIADPTAV